MKKSNTSSKTISDSIVIADDTASLSLDKTDDFLKGLPVEKSVYDNIKGYERDFLTGAVKTLAEELGTIKKTDASNLMGTAKISDYLSVQVVKNGDTNPIVVVKNSYDVEENTLDSLKKLIQKG
jgi:hypothetical protein